MPSKKRNTNKPASGVAPLGVSRRDFVKRAAAGAGGIAFAGRISTAFAQAADVIKIGFVSPRTGPLGGFGEGDPFVLGLARKALANGITSGGKKYKVEIIDQDLQSDPSRASQLAKSMISTDNVDLMLVTSTPEVVNPVSDACESGAFPASLPSCRGKPGISAAAPSPASPRRSNGPITSRSASPNSPRPTFPNGKTARVPTNKKIGVMFPNDADGNALRQHMIPIFEKAGFTVFDPGGYLKTALPTIRHRSPSTRLRACKSSPAYQSRPTLPRSGDRRRSKVSRRP